MKKLLETFGATDIKHQFLFDKQNEKTRFLFVINEQDSALNCYNHFIHNPTVNNGINSAKIFYIKPGKWFWLNVEPIFMKYADKEAEEYVKAEEANKLAKEARTKKQDYQRKQRTYNNQN